MRIAVVGTGGIGGYFGGMLAKGGNEVTIVAREENFKAIKNNGLHVNSVLENFVVKPWGLVENISEIEKPELVLFTVKTYDTEVTARELAKVIDEKCIVLTFQNGIDNDFLIKKFISNATVCPGAAYIITAKTAPGVISQTGGLRRLIFGNRNGTITDDLNKIEIIMKKSEIDCVLSSNINTDIWKKFILICAFSGMTGLYRKTIGEILSDTTLKSEFETCVKENIALAKLLNIQLPDNIFELTMKTATDTEAKSKSSLLIDLENNRKTEIDTLNGKVVSFSQELGLPTPINTKIYEGIKQNQGSSR